MMYLPYWMLQQPGANQYGAQSAQQMVAPWYGQGTMQAAGAPLSPTAQFTQGNATTGGLSAMLQNEQAMQGIAALGQALASRKSGAAPMAPAPPAQIYSGNPNFVPRF